MRSVMPSTTASRKSDWISARRHMKDLPVYLFRMRAFVKQGRERRDVVVPFDERRLRSEAAKSVSVQIPRCLGDRRGVCIDPYFGAGSGFVVFRSIAAHMEFADFAGRESVNVVSRVMTHVVRAHHDVADIAQQLT